MHEDVRRGAEAGGGTFPPPRQFVVLALLQSLFALEYLVYASWPPSPSGHPERDLVVGVLMVPLALATVWVVPRLPAWTLDVSLAATWLGVVAVAANRTTGQGQVVFGSSLLLVAVYAAYFRAERRMWWHVAVMLGSYVAVLVATGLVSDPLYAAVVVLSLLVVSGVVSRLASADRHYRIVLDSASDVVFENVDGLLRWVSPSVTELLGWTPTELLGSSSVHLWHPEDRDVAVAMRDAAAAGHPSRRTLRYRTKAGDYLWVEMSLRPFVDQRGRPGVAGSLRDVHEQVEAERALAMSERRYRLLLENASDVVAHVNDGVVVWVSSSLVREMGWARSDWLGSPFARHVHPDDRASVAGLWETTDAGGTASTRIRVRDRTGVDHWVRLVAGPYADETGRVEGARVAFHVVDEEVAAERELELRARHDALTGLLNRSEVMERLAAITTHDRRTAHLCAVLFCDLDRFKLINDAFGHATGDDVLRVVAERVRASVRAADLTARVGGDEILVVLDGVQSLDDATRIAEKVRHAVSRPIDVDGDEVTPTVSIGVSVLHPGESVRPLVARADEAMYRAKRSGRDQVVTLG